MNHTSIDNLFLKNVQLKKKNTRIKQNSAYRLKNKRNTHLHVNYISLILSLQYEY
jgi:hypothetical protein